MDNIPIKFKKLSQNARIPEMAPGTPAGIDLFSADNVTLKPGEVKIVPTDIAWEISPEYYGQVHDRSGIGSKTTLSTKCGVIDPDYRGNIGIVFTNTGDKPVSIEKGMKIAQMVIHKRYDISISESKALSESQRNSGGFGSTGQ